MAEGWFYFKCEGCTGPVTYTVTDVGTSVYISIKMYTYDQDAADL